MRPCGSVDDGKSTLIGRLLYDSKQIFEDQLEAVERTSLSRGDEYVNLALLTDGLRAEREQGITIDVAYRYFSTPQAPVHHRRHPRAHPAHAQHGHGLFDLRSRVAAHRRPQRGNRADAAPRHDRLAVGHPSRRAVREQDGPRRLLQGALRRDPRRVHRLRRAPRGARPHLHPDLGPRRRQRRGPLF